MQTNSKNIVIVFIALIVLIFALSFFIIYGKPNSVKQISKESAIKTSGNSNDLLTLSQKIDSFGDISELKEEQKASFVQAHFDRLKYIQKNKQEVNSYLIQNFGKKGNIDYKNLFLDYALSDFLVGEGGDMSLPDYLEQTKNQDLRNGTDWFVETGYSFLSRQNIYFLDSGVILVILINDENSGAYNYDSYVYTYIIKDGQLVSNVPKFITYNKKNNKVEDLSSSEGFALSNIIYSTDAKQLITEPFKPFGAYPCGEDSYYDVYFDRLILTRTEIPEYCIGKDLSDPNSEDSILAGEKSYDVFEKRKVIYSINQAEHKKLEDFILK